MHVHPFTNDCHGSVYTEHNPFNCDATKFYVYVDGVMKLYDLNKTAFTISNKRDLFTTKTPYLRGSELCWDADDPNLLYGSSTTDLIRLGQFFGRSVSEGLRLQHWMAPTRLSTKFRTQR